MKQSAHGACIGMWTFDNEEVSNGSRAMGAAVTGIPVECKGISRKNTGHSTFECHWSAAPTRMRRDRIGCLQLDRRYEQRLREIRSFKTHPGGDHDCHLHASRTEY